MDCLEFCWLGIPELDLLVQNVGSVMFCWLELAPETSLVLDMHSHGRGSAFFSETDNRSDQGTPHFSLVVGNCAESRPMAELDTVIRLCLSEFFFEDSKRIRLWKHPGKEMTCGIISGH